MFDFIDTLPHKFQALIAVVLVLATFCLLSLLAAEIKMNQVPTKAPHSSMVASSSLLSWGNGDSANVVANGLGMAAATFVSTVDATGVAVSDGAGAMATSLARSGTYILRGPMVIIRGVGTGAVYTGRAIAGAWLFSIRTVGSGLLFAGRMVGNSIVFVFSLPFRTFGLISDTPVVSAMIRPANDMPAPVIDSNAAGLFAPSAVTAKTATHATPKKQKPSPSPKTQWPIHGAITTLFGVPELPYEAIHTGLDISDGKAPGITPVHAFKAGKVIATIYGYTGLGNHVIIDHGDGLQSVYGHLHAISVHVGQQVTTSTVVGYEGSTGVSTGTHLHFEVHVNGTPVDPHRYIAGQP